MKFKINPLVLWGLKEVQYLYLIIIKIYKICGHRVCTYETAIDTRAVYLGKKKNIIGIKHHFRKVFMFSGVHVKVDPFVSIALFSNLDTSSSKFGKI